jgi:SAM domain (Sterile alpha motif)
MPLHQSPLRDPKRPLTRSAKQRIGGLQNVILVVSRRDPYCLARNAVDISACLQELGLECYVEAFQDNAVDARSLPHLTAEDLKEMAVAAIGHRRLLKAIGQREASLPWPGAATQTATVDAGRASTPLPRSSPPTLI